MNKLTSFEDNDLSIEIYTQIDLAISLAQSLRAVSFLKSYK